MSAIKIRYTGWIHHKNIHGLNLLKSEGIDVAPLSPEEKDEPKNLILFVHDRIDINLSKKYTNVIAGPHVDFFNLITQVNELKTDRKINFNMLSDWNRSNIMKETNNPMVNFISIPYPVDINRYKPLPTGQQDQFFVYFKGRHPGCLQEIRDMIDRNQEKLPKNYRIFCYGSYRDDDYLNYIQNCRFGIWVGSHESQGFALEEALSCNVPLFIYNVKSLKDEFAHGRFIYQDKNSDLIATTAPYFSDQCGMIVNSTDDLDNQLRCFMNNLSKNIYSPREYVVTNLSTTQFKERLKKLFELP